MKFSPADLKWKLRQLDKEALVCQISATRVSMDFIYPKTYIVLLAVVASENLQNRLSVPQTRSCSAA